MSCFRKDRKDKRSVSLTPSLSTPLTVSQQVAIPPVRPWNKKLRDGLWDRCRSEDSDLK